jgi:HAD superfamily hydrolase (TIGR01509 family)
MPYQGIIFDFNGVLWWDNALQAQAWRRFSAWVRGTPLSDEEMAIHVHGRNNPHTLSYLAGRPVEGEELARLIEAKETIYRQLCLDLGEDFRLSPGAPALLDLLAAQGIPRTIATASGRANVDFFVTHLELGRWFEVERFVYDDGHLPGKPAPDMYRRAAANLGLAPARCIVVEDSRSGIQAARASAT